ncbi:MAG: signal peptide peptidase SppA [Mucispirillum sp.]|nr:signal peptide peptidase SppA [Mucispirillum sp.]
MKKWIKVIIAVCIAAVFIRAVAVMAGFNKKGGITGDSIAVIDFKGEIYESASFIDALRELKENNLVKGVVIRVNSPGGAVTPSMEIYDYILKMGKPVYAAMGSVAASGGYLISLGADSIYAEPSTITGSIGVIMNLVNTQELMEKIGIQSVVIKSGVYKDSGSPARPMTEGDREVLNAVLMDMYHQFTDIVASRRGLTKEDTLKLADGRIYTGKMAHEVKLINKLGSWRDAADDMKSKLNLPNINYYEVPEKKTLLEELLEMSSMSWIKETGKALQRNSGFFYLSEIR